MELIKNGINILDSSILYRLYSFTCALGAHKNEGNMTISGVDHEETDIEDALLALRMTEDTLIWFYKKL